MLKIVIFLLVSFLFFFASAQELSPKEENGKWGFVNGNSEWIIKPQYASVSSFSDNLSCVSKKGKWGYINKVGKLIIPFQYSQAKPFVNGYAAVRSPKVLPGNTRENNNQFKWGFINTNGDLVVDYLFKNVKEFDSEGRCLVSLFNMKTNELFWINKEGKAVSPPFIKKEKRNNTYFITNERKDGKKVYRYIKPSGESITNWYLNDFKLTDTLIKVWLPTKNDNDTLQELAYGGNSRKKVCAFIDSNGKVLTDWYSEIKVFRKGYAAVRKNYLYGFINDDFKLVTPPTYREVVYLKNDTYKAQIQFGQTVLLSISGARKSNICFDFENYSEDLLLGLHQLKSKEKTELRYAIFNLEGKQKSSWYNKIHQLSNGIARVEEIKFNYKNNQDVKSDSYYNSVKISTGELITNWRISSEVKWEAKSNKTDSILTYLYLSTPIINLNLNYFNTVFIKEFVWDKKNEIYLFFRGRFS